MESKKYIGLDVHQASISAAVRDDAGKLVMECVIETKAGTILEFIRGLRGSLCVTFEEGTSAAWLYELVKPHVAQVVVCDPRKNALLKVGNKNDRVDARKLSELLRVGLLTPVYHGDSGVRTLRELSRSYLTVTKDLTRVMNRTKALYRSWAIPCAGEKVHSPRGLRCGENPVETASLFFHSNLKSSLSWACGYVENAPLGVIQGTVDNRLRFPSGPAYPSGHCCGSSEQDRATLVAREPKTEGEV